MNKGVVSPCKSDLRAHWPLSATVTARSIENGEVSGRIEKDDSCQGGDPRTTQPGTKEERRWDLNDPSLAREDSSIMDMLMGLGSILFIDGEAVPPRQEMDIVPTDNENLLLSDERMFKEVLEGDKQRPFLGGQAVAK